MNLTLRGTEYDPKKTDLDLLDTHTAVCIFSSLSRCVETQIVMCSLPNKMLNVEMRVFKDLTALLCILFLT